MPALEYNAKYVCDRCMIGVERQLGLSFIKKPQISLRDLSGTGKEGLCHMGTGHIVIDADMEGTYRDIVLCHELIHFAGISSEKVAYDNQVDAVFKIPV